MANFSFWKTNDWLARAGQSLATADLRVLLVMTNSTAPADVDAEFLDEIATLDECDAGAYARVDLASVGLTANDTDDRSEVRSDDADWGALDVGVSGRDLKGALIYFHLGAGTDAENRPWIWYDTVASGPIFPFTLNGGNVKLVEPATGWLHVLGS